MGEKGRIVKIVTAWVAPLGRTREEVETAKRIILRWCMDHNIPIADITCSKDFAMLELWDDRAVQVIPNTGERADGLP